MMLRDCLSSGEIFCISVHRHRRVAWFKRTDREWNNRCEWIRFEWFRASGCINGLDNIDYQLPRVSHGNVSLPSSNSDFREQIVYLIDRLFAVNRYLVRTSYVQSEFKVRDNLVVEGIKRSHEQSKYCRERHVSILSWLFGCFSCLIDTNCSSKLFPISCFQPLQFIQFSCQLVPTLHYLLNNS